MTALPAFLDNLFIGYAKENPVFFVSWIFTVVLSVTLHELGHAYAAIKQGDETPRLAGHWTLNPLVHMGGMSLVFLFVAGIAWGATPVDPTRFRSKWGDAIVSGAGPAVNLLLAVLGLTVLGVWLRTSGRPDGEVAQNFVTFLWVFGTANIVLLLLNLIPIPPLDGSSVVANFSPTYRGWIRDPDNHGVFFAAFIGVFLLAPYLFQAADEAAAVWIRLFTT